MKLELTIFEVQMIADLICEKASKESGKTVASQVRKMQYEKLLNDIHGCVSKELQAKRDYLFSDVDCEQ